MRSKKQNIWGLNKTRVNLRHERQMRSLLYCRKRPLASYRFLDENLSRFMKTWSSRDSLSELFSLF